VARAEAYPHAMFHLDPSNHLATIHQCHRQTGQDDGPIAWGKPFYKRSLKNWVGENLFYLQVINTVDYIECPYNMFEIVSFCLCFYRDFYRTQ